MSKTPKDTKRLTHIYTLSDPITNEIRYIGKTVKPLNIRLADHLYSVNRENNYRTNWIKSVINKKCIPKIELIESVPWDKSQEVEIYWIAQFKVWGFKLVNLTDGGEGCINRKLSDHTIQKIKESNSKKVYQYDLEGNFIKEWTTAIEAGKFLGKSNSKICAAARGSRKKAYNYQWSYIKLSNLNKYKREKITLSDKQKEIKKLKLSKPVLQFDRNGIFIKEWESAKVAAKTLDLNYISIIEYLNGKRVNHRSNKYLGNFIWERKK